MACPNEMVPNFFWDERQKKVIMERFRLWRSPTTPEEIKLYLEINSKIDEFVCLMADNDEKNAQTKATPKKKVRKRSLVKSGKKGRNAGE